MRQDSVFPIIDRRTPVLDRIRGGDEEDIAETLGRLIGEGVKSDNEEEMDQRRANAAQGFRKGLASELGVSEDSIRDDVIGDIAQLFGGVTEQDVLDDQTLEQLGISRGVEEEEDREAGEGGREEQF